MPPARAFLFTAWFRDHTFLPDEQDHEWPACFEVIAESAELALLWGKKLATEYATRNTSLVLQSSSIEALSDGASGELPLVHYGVAASDAEIGW